MDYRTLGNTGLRVSVLGLGALHFGTYNDLASTRHIVHYAMDAGINFIDTAPSYGNGLSESFIGQVLGARRSEVLLGTKVGRTLSRLPDGSGNVMELPLTRDNIRRSLHASLRKLGTDYVDLYQIHAFDQIVPLDITLSAIEELVQEGKVRFVGCSNFLRHEMESLVMASSGFKDLNLISLQTRYNLIERYPERALSPVCQKLGASFICYHALARGILTGKYQWNQNIPEGSRAQLSVRVRNALSEQRLQAIDQIRHLGMLYSRSMTELAIAWLLARPTVGTIVIGVRSIQQLAMNILAQSWQFPENLAMQIDEIFENAGLLSNIYALPEDLVQEGVSH